MGSVYMTIHRYLTMIEPTLVSFLHNPDENHVNNFRDVNKFCDICPICRLSFQSMHPINLKNDCRN